VTVIAGETSPVSTSMASRSSANAPVPATSSRHAWRSDPRARSGASVVHRLDRQLGIADPVDVAGIGVATGSGVGVAGTGTGVSVGADTMGAVGGADAGAGTTGVAAQAAARSVTAAAMTGARRVLMETLAFGCDGAGRWTSL
jgi:hypothetical protein